jgi:hypothetical protein
MREGPDEASQTVVVLAGHKSSGEAVREELLVEPLGDGTLRLLATPAPVLGVAAGDLISVGHSGQVAVQRRGGNLAVQVYSADGQAPELIGEFAGLGAQVDSRARGLTVLTVPVAVGFPRVEAVLRAYVAAHPGVEWYFGNVYADDGVTPLNWWMDPALPQSLRRGSDGEAEVAELTELLRHDESFMELRDALAANGIVIASTLLAGLIERQDESREGVLVTDDRRCIRF